MPVSVGGGVHAVNGPAARPCPERSRRVPARFFEAVTWESRRRVLAEVSVKNRRERGAPGHGSHERVAPLLKGF